MEEKKANISTGKSLLVLLISLFILLFGVAVLKANAAMCLALTGIIACYMGMAMGCKWADFEKSMGETINSMFIGILIMMFVGALIGAWMSSGTVPLLMYYGLKFIPAPIFLVATCLVCAVMSIMTGTSWGTIGTIGVALLGVSEGLGIPMPYTVGAIVVGALVGDKLSPLSDTTILAPYVSGCDIIEHIKSMLFTTVPALIISLILYFILGMQYRGGAVESESYFAILAALEENFNLNPILLLPPVITLVLIFMRKPTLPVFGAGILIAVLLAMAVQGRTLPEVLAACAGGMGAATGNDLLDNMVNRGGLLNMMSSVALIIGAAVFSGALKTVGVFSMLVETMEKTAKSPKTLLFFSYILHMALCSLTGSYFVTFSVVGPLLAPIFDRYNLSRKNLSRMLEDTGTAFAPIIPWSAISVFLYGTLGVTPADYVIYAPITYLGIITAMIYIFTGFGIFKTDGTMYFQKEKK